MVRVGLPLILVGLGQGFGAVTDDWRNDVSVSASVGTHLPTTGTRGVYSEDGESAHHRAHGHAHGRPPARCDVAVVGMGWAGVYSAWRLLVDGG